MKVKVFNFTTSISETDIQDWLDSHSTARILAASNSSLSVVIFYVE